MRKQAAPAQIALAWQNFGAASLRITSAEIQEMNRSIAVLVFSDVEAAPKK